MLVDAVVATKSFKSSRRFIRNFSKIAAPMQKLAKKEAIFMWNEACEEAVRALKEAVTQDPVLRQFDRNREAIT